MKASPRLIALLLAPAALLAHAEEPVRSAAASGSAVTFGSALQVVLGLAVVLAMVAGTAWVVKRLGATQQSANGLVRVLSGAAVGQRERVVLLEIHGTWVVVGVAPGHVTALHTMAKPQDYSVQNAQGPAPTPFAHWFKQTLERRRNG
jgi:flagellar protein FliO/FliZ